MRTRSTLLALVLGIASLAPAQQSVGASPGLPVILSGGINCDEEASQLGLCVDRASHTNYEGDYVGHDEPAVLFLSNEPGSGNSSRYRLILPREPPIPPRQDGRGGTDNFQLAITFWMGMALCDSESFPEYTHSCVPDSDSNVFDNADPTAPDFIGHHPGSAILEVQLYPPGWLQGCTPTQWCASMGIDSFSYNGATGEVNNSDCLERVGYEPVNFALITTDGIPPQPANPLGLPFGRSSGTYANLLLMNPGDSIIVTIEDTPRGVQVQIEDSNTGALGQMTASKQNGFGQVIFAPTAATCSVRPYAFHPMYSTSTEHTRVGWVTHSFNVAFSEEIGHFEYCNAADPQTLLCTSPGANDRSGLDADDVECIGPTSDLNPPPFLQLGGCVGEDDDFDGVSYHRNWPGSNPLTDALLHPEPVRFTSPMFRGPNGWRNYQRVTFENDASSIDFECNVFTGADCVDPPHGAEFYPLYSTARVGGGCMWQFGGPLIPGTINSFGGTATAEFGPLTALLYAFAGLVEDGPLYEVFQRPLASNPCPVGSNDDLDSP